MRIINKNKLIADGLSKYLMTKYGDLLFAKVVKDDVWIYRVEPETHTALRICKARISDKVKIPDRKLMDELINEKLKRKGKVR